VQKDPDLESRRTEMTILFSDIKDSTKYAAEEGDFKYMAMIDRHNRILFPVIEAEGGSVVKTIGDSILAKFQDRLRAVKAAVGMQRALAKDREGREEIDHIRIRVGLHHGIGFDKENDVFGDVVNVASRVEHQAEPDQVLITNALLEAARTAGFECAKMGRVELKGKDNPIDLYAVAWSKSATQQLITELELRHEKEFNELKKEFNELKAARHQLEQAFDAAREQWRGERRALNAEIEQLETSRESALQTARDEILEELQAELRFQVEQLTQSHEQLEQDLASAHQRFEAERNNLKAQIAALQARIVEAMERLNNPVRNTAAVRELVEARVADAKEEWQSQWDAERKRLTTEIDRLKKALSVSTLDKNKEAARRAVLEKLGKLPPISAGRLTKAANQSELEFEHTKSQWETERQQLNDKIKKLEADLRRSLRSENLQETHAQYEQKLAEATRERQRLEDDIQALTSELASERQRLTARVKALEQALPEAQQAARKQAIAEMQSQFNSKIDEADQLISRFKRQYLEALQDLKDEQRRSEKLEEQLRDARAPAEKI
jgi:class 3 adenylate cyclase